MDNNQIGISAQKTSEAEQSLSPQESSVDGGVPVAGNSRSESVMDVASPAQPPVSEKAQSEDASATTSSISTDAEKSQAEGVSSSIDVTPGEVRNRADSELPAPSETSNQAAEVPPTLGEVAAKDVDKTPTTVTSEGAEISQTPSEAPRPTVDAVSAGALTSAELVKGARDESGAANLEAQIGGADDQQNNQEAGALSGASPAASPAEATPQVVQESSVASPTEALPTPESVPENTAPQMSPTPPEAQAANQPVSQLPSESNQSVTPDVPPVITPEDASISEKLVESEASESPQETIGQIYNLLDKLKLQVGNNQSAAKNPEVQTGQDKAA